MPAVTICSDFGGLASITIYPSLRQSLQNARLLMQGRPNQTHAFMEWIKAASHIMWSNVGELLDTMSKWDTYVQLMQVVRELDMQQLIFLPNSRDSDDECFTGNIQYAILNNAPSTALESRTAILVTFVWCHIYEVTLIVASLGETEGQQEKRGLEAWRPWRGPELVKAPSWWWECKRGLICWQQELTNNIDT